MNQNPNSYPRDLFYCATSNVIVGTEQCRLYLLASNAEQAAKYTWPTKTRKRTRYVVSCERLAGLQYADEIEAAANRFGFSDNHPHICDVMEVHKSLASVIIETNALRWALSFLPDEGVKTVAVNDKGLSIQGVPLGGIALYSAEMLVRSRPLRLAFEQMPCDETAHVDILGHHHARALKISLGLETHYVFDYRNGFTAFIPRGDER
jgi:hypothetical protein